MTRALMPLADGCEEMESVVPIDILRRAQWDVITAGLRPGPVTASRQVRLIPDRTWDEIHPADFDVLVIPGGGTGVENLRRDPRILDAVRQFHRDGKWIAAICAGPKVLQDAGILGGRTVTCHPDVVSQITQAQVREKPVMVDGRLVTGRGAGASFLFALTIVAQVDGREKAEQIAHGIVLPGGFSET